MAENSNFGQIRLKRNFWPFSFGRKFQKWTNTPKTEFLAIFIWPKIPF
jgi:hypothetical protein